VEQKYVFDGREAAEAFATAHVRQTFSSSETDVAAFLAEAQLIGKESVERTVPPGGSPVLIPHFRWVIKNDDLALMDAILDGVRSAAAAGFFVGAPLAHPAEWGAIAGIAVPILKVCRNAIREGKTLDPHTYTVLAAVKSLGPISESALLESLCTHDKKWTLEAVRAALMSLKAMPVANGEPRQLVSENESGQWRTAGV